MVAAVDSAGDDEFAARDPHLWTLEVESRQTPEGLVIHARAGLPGGAPAAWAQVGVWLDVDDFTRAFRTSARADASGAASLTIPQAALRLGSGRRYVHITAGESWPLAERILALG